MTEAVPQELLDEARRDVATTETDWAALRSKWSTGNISTEHYHKYAPDFWSRRQASLDRLERLLGGDPQGKSLWQRLDPPEGM